MADNVEQFKGGDTVSIGGTDYKISGYFDIGDGQNRYLYRKGFSYYYIDSNYNLQKVKESGGYKITIDKQTYEYKSIETLAGPRGGYITPSDIDSKVIGSNAKVDNVETTAVAETQGATSQNTSGGTGVATTTSYSSYNKVTGGDVHNIDGKDYIVAGFADTKGGNEHRIIYQDSNGTYYCRFSDGTMQKIDKPSSWDLGTVIEGEKYTFHDAKYGSTKVEFEPSDIDKKYLSGSAEQESTTTTPNTSPTYSNIAINEKIDLNQQIVKKMIFKVTYTPTAGWNYRQTYATETANDEHVMTQAVYNVTPGQGKTAQSMVNDFQKNIGCIKYLMEKVIDLSKTAAVRKGNPVFLREAEDIYDYIEEITPDVYCKFVNKALWPTIRYCNDKQARENNIREEKIIIKYNDLKNQEANRNGLIGSVTQSYNIKIEKTFGTYSVTGYYSHGRQLPIVTAPEESNVTSIGEITMNDIDVDVCKIDAMAFNLQYIINNHILPNNNLIEESVEAINKVSSFTTAITRLKPEDVNEKLMEFKRIILRFKEKLINYALEARKYDKGKNNPTPVNPTPSPKPGPSSWPSTGGGGTPTPTPTTSAPTTEVPTDNRTTEPPVVQPRIDDKTDNGGSNGGSNGGGTPINGNSHGGDYSPYGGYSESSSETSSAATSTEVPKEAADVIKEGNSYTLPTSSKPVQPTTPTTSKGNSAIPVLAGLAAAAAAGIGAKAYIDRKKNRNNDEESEEFKAEDWSGNNEINIEYQEPKTTEAETLDDDYDFEEPEKYGARSNQELENLQ